MNITFKKILISFLFLPLLSSADTLNLSSSPLFVGGQVSPLVMLVMGRDHTLYYEAYNDASDLDGNGRIDNYELRYSPTKLSNYYGIFDANLCYDYSTKNEYFTPVAKVASITTKECSNGKWSGDFLNYLTTARIDALRVVLYGGKRAIDSNTQTVLSRTTLPHDAHSWGKVYTPDMATTVDNPFDITKYAGLPSNLLPNSGEQVFFANTSLTENGEPLLRVVKINNQTTKIWNWLSKERPVADKTILNYGDVSPEDYIVRVETCKSGYISSNCQTYGQIAKPIGLLQQYAGSMKFGLITGSYENNLSGGVIRQLLHSISDEIDSSTGKFLFTRNNNTPGVIGNIDRLKVYGYNYSNNQYDCGWITTSALTNGTCKSWGNPLAEMLYESIRYFSGAKKATYDTSPSSSDDSLNLSKENNWSDPFANNSGNATCAKPVNLVISSLTPTYDSDQLPGSVFNSSYEDSTKFDSSSFNAKSATDIISNKEGFNGQKYFIGEVHGQNDATGAPTAKAIDSLSNIRGLSPEDPTKQGSFYSAGVSYFGHEHDLNTKSGTQKLFTEVVALSSPLPQIKIPVNGKFITLVPYAKSVGGSGISANKNNFQPTNQIVDYYIESLSDTSGVFQINYEDVEQGADHDMDMIVRYSYVVSGSSVNITVESLYAAGGINQHAGYVISGTNRDGLYLDVRDRLDNNESDNNYYLDTPGTDNISRESSQSDLHLGIGPITRTFTTSTDSTAAGFLPSPLWYAAKWGGFDDVNGNGFPDAGEWDSKVTGQPDNYFSVTNASKLPEQMADAFQNIADNTMTASALSFSSQVVRTDSLVFKASFNTKFWSGELNAYKLNKNGSIDNTAMWSASSQLASQTENSRSIFTNNGLAMVDFSEPISLDGSATGLSSTQITQLLSASDQKPSTDTEKLILVKSLVKYIRGDRSNEGAATGKFRQRKHKLGDIVDSIPVPGVSVADKKPFVIVGANDGMVHVFDARMNSSDGGKELFSFVPSPIYSDLAKLSNLSYSHQYYVNGGISVATVTDNDNKKHKIAVGSLGQGAQGLYALDLTDLSSVNMTASKRVLWEFTDSNDADLGYIMGAPSIVQLSNGRWAAIFGNGYNNTTADNYIGSSKAVIYIVDLFTGTLIKKLDSKTGSASDPANLSRPNAMAQPAVVDKDQNDKADTIYAGDLFGNLWKFDISNISADSWGTALGSNDVPQPLFIALAKNNKAQPITTEPSVASHATRPGLMILFGTGKYIGSEDINLNSPDTQSFYGIWDNDATGTIARSSLQEREITKEIGDIRRLIDTDTSKSITPAAIDWTTKKGWVLDLKNHDSSLSPAPGNKGERQITNSVSRFQKLSFTTLIPSDDPCKAGGSGWYMELDATEGTSWVQPTDDIDPTDPDSYEYLTNRYSGTGIPTAPSVIYTLDEDGKATETTIVRDSSLKEQIVSSEGLSSGRNSWKLLY